MPVTVLPNWVDLVVLTILFIKSYRGFYGGVLTEFFKLIGLVSVIAATVNYASVVTEWLSPWLVFGPVVSALIVFWLIFLGGYFLVYRLLSLVSKLVKWERLHWTTQVIGLVFGALQGLCWAGLILLILTTSGFVYLQESVEPRSLLGSRLLPITRESVQRISERFPGAQHRLKTLVPPIRGVRPQSGNSRIFERGV